MARTTEALRPTPASPNGQRAARAGGLEVTPAVRRRPTWAIAGIGLIVLAMLLGAWVFAAQSSTTQVLVAARDLDAGEVVTSADFRVVELSNAGGLRAVQPAEQSLIVGKATRGPVPAGTVLNTGLFVDAGQSVPAGEVVVGVALDPGASPSTQLSPGNRVEVLAVARTVAGSTQAAPATAQVLATGTVWAVEPIGTGASSAGRVWVSLLIPQSTHGAVAQAASEGRLSLGLLGAGS